MIHHLTFEIDKKLLTEELEFWSLLGFAPTGLRRRSRKQPPIHWLVGGDHGHAVELLPVDVPRVSHLGHVAFAVPQRRWQIATQRAAQLGIYRERCDHFDFGQHCYLKSPSGHMVELFTNNKALKAGPPLEERNAESFV